MGAEPGKIGGQHRRCLTITAADLGDDRRLGSGVEQQGAHTR
jgi:hypothetical protein